MNATSFVVEIMDANMDSTLESCFVYPRDADGDNGLLLVLFKAKTRPCCWIINCFSQTRSNFEIGTLSTLLEGQTISKFDRVCAKIC